MSRAPPREEPRTARSLHCPCTSTPPGLSVTRSVTRPMYVARRPAISLTGVILLVSTPAVTLPAQRAPEPRWTARVVEPAIPRLPATPALATTSQPATSPLAASRLAASSDQPLFTAGDAALAAAFAAATVALFPLDRRLALRLQDSSTQANRVLKHTATGFRVLGFPGSIIITSGLYAVGRLSDRDRTADLGLHATEAIVLGEGVTGVVKVLAGRARPYVVADTNPRDFRFGRGIRRARDYVSFPSGHSTAAFATAAAVTSEVSRWSSGPEWVVGPLMYGAATATGLSRMYNNEHWASDVVLGAAIGTFAGLKVVRYSHAHPDNLIDRRLLESRARYGRRTPLFVWSMPWPR
jgi:membrane-associated phospholipid phosphatase